MGDRRVAVVTGAAGAGMGRSIALTLARCGFDLVVNTRKNLEAARAVCEAVSTFDAASVPVVGDVSSTAGCQSLVGECLARFGRVDACVISSPGAGWHPDTPDRLKPDDAVADSLAELSPVFSLVPLVLPSMSERRWGRIVAITMNPRLPSPSHSYNVAKSARARAVLSIADFAWKHGVTVNVVAPGPVEALGDLSQAIQYARQGPAGMGRDKLGPQDIAEGVAFLCSESGRYVTGTELTYSFGGPAGT
jgi:NAD(P)-dependent dehydrogenase (short-subunit alcohol dehydrogenase family)